MRFKAGQREQSVTMIGYQDFDDDGDGLIKVGIGPCKSTDPLFDFATVNSEMASTWNEDYPFAKIDTIKPSASSMLGEMVAIRGRYLDRVARVCVAGIDVSQEPDFRASVIERNEAGVAIQDEVELTSPEALRWFADITGNATGIPIRRNVTSSRCAQSLGSSPRRRQVPSAVGADMSTNSSRPGCPQCKTRVLRLYIQAPIDHWLASDTLSVERTLAARFEVPNSEEILAKVRGNPEQKSIAVTVTLPAGVRRFCLLRWQSLHG
jgi:hypothetical protein